MVGTLAACSDPFIADPVRAYQAVAVGAEHSCAVSESGEVYCWGRGSEGQLGNGVTGNRARPERVSGSVIFEDIAAGAAHTCALAATGVVYCWGANDDGQLGSAGAAPDDGPVQIATAERFVSISAAGHTTCALSVDAVAYCWGRNDVGQVGNGTFEDVNTPQPVSGNIRFVQLSTGGEHACGVVADGRIYCWGRNDYGQLGDGSIVPTTTPVAVAANGVEFLQVDAGATHTCALARASQLYCWGSDVFGELGVGAAYDGKPGAALPLPVSAQFPELGAGVFVGAGKDHACSIGIDRVARCWGRGDQGHIGNGRFDHQFFPQTIHLQAIDLYASDFFLITRLAVGGVSHVCALASKSVYCWGVGEHGELGIPGSAYAPLPQRIAD
jgi:alpha-tubulin suppressor-like RCC1 family protein